MRKKTIEDYYALAQTRNFKWLGEDLPPNTTTKSLWCCDQGHEWQGEFNSIQRGVGCPVCWEETPKRNVQIK